MNNSARRPLQARIIDTSAMRRRIETVAQRLTLQRGGPGTRQVLLERVLAQNRAYHFSSMGETRLRVPASKELLIVHGH